MEEEIYEIPESQITPRQDHDLQQLRDLASESMPEAVLRGLEPNISQKTFDMRQPSINPTQAAFESRLSNYADDKNMTTNLQTVAAEL